MASPHEAEACPLCLEALDITDLACQFCTCGYSMCLWCWHRIREDAAKQSLPARCPNCRTVYQKERVRMDTIDPDQLEDTRRRKKDDRKKAAVSQPKARRDLANVRVVQRNLVYAVGLAMEICYEDTLMGPEFFGAFGKMVKQMSVNRMGPYGSAVGRNGPTGSAYITFKRPEDAKRCIEAVNGVTWGGKQVKACFGTTKYCNAFLKGVACNNPDCLYLHDIAEEVDSYTKEETKSSKFINLTHAASVIKQPPLSLFSGTPPTGSAAHNRLQGASSSNLMPRQCSLSQMSEAGSGLAATNCRADQDGCEMSGPSWAGSPPSSSWLTKAASTHSQPSASVAPSTPVPPAADEQEWPELGGGTASFGGPSSTNPTEQPAVSSSAAASETPHSSHQHARSRASGATPSKSASKADAGAAGKLPAKANSSRSPAKADSSSPDQRRPSTPSPVNVQPLLPETPVSGRTTASGSPADTPSSALHSLHSTPHASQKQNAPATSSERAQSAAAQQAEAQQQQQRHGMLHLPTVSSSDVQHDPVVQLVSRRSSGRVPPPGFSGPVAPCASAALSTASRSKGPPPGFGTPPASNGNVAPGFPSHSGSDCSATSVHNQHAHHWPPGQDAQQHWSNFHQYHSGANVGGASGLYQPQSAAPTGYQSEPFAMPGLSNLQSMRQQPGADHSLFSGSSNGPAFSPSQFRQRSRFPFAQDQLAAQAADFASASSASLLPPASQQHSSPFQYGYDQSQQDRQHLDHHLFSSSSCLTGGSLFSGPQGLANPRGGPHRPGLHMPVGSHGGDPGTGSVTTMGFPGLPGGSTSQDVAPGQALLRQLQMSQSPQRAQQHHQQQQQQQLWQDCGTAASGWDVYSIQAASPFFDPAIVTASSAALREADPASAAAAAPVQMPLLPGMASCPATATASANAVGSPVKPDNGGDASGDASAPAPGLQTPPKSGKRRRGGRGTKGGAAHRSPQIRGRGKGGNINNPSSADMAMLQQQYDQAKSQLAISGAQLAQAQQKFQNIQI